MVTQGENIMKTWQSMKLLERILNRLNRRNLFDRPHDLHRALLSLAMVGACQVSLAEPATPAALF